MAFDGWDLGFADGGLLVVVGFEYGFAASVAVLAEERVARGMIRVKGFKMGIFCKELNKRISKKRKTTSCKSRRGHGGVSI